MAGRAFWKGYLKLSLVTCPVAMTPATSESEKVRFHTLSRATGARVVSEYVDSVTGDPVEREDEVKGYPRGEDDHVLLEDEELDAVALDTTHTIDVEMFAPADSVGWIWYDKPHYLVPDDKVGEEAFSVIREAMAATGMVGISRLVLYRRERAVLLEPRGKGIVLWTLRYGDEVRDPEDYFGGLETDKPDPKLMTLVTSLIEERTKPWSPKMVDDPVQARLLELIASRKKGRKTKPKAKAEEPAETGKVISIMDALRKSLAKESGGKR
ncbi:DNA end-binding protein Ku [Methylopila capsulata]|uniref:Non-homologous end joining protein Ku n=1 Tax=Methylopila capsulata TaxID=61654 RepID=A0A9W6IY32_9HYPH|nr:Ku protein [Methylopila capsulata]MBM7853554.1 DNA end-binding protein Ku [Methylopila capsulata]GLK57231.1 non-homologous end joining protein Ku [Methylopila capsulata]